MRANGDSIGPSLWCCATTLAILHHEQQRPPTPPNGISSIATSTSTTTTQLLAHIETRVPEKGPLSHTYFSRTRHIKGKSNRLRPSDGWSKKILLGSIGFNLAGGGGEPFNCATQVAVS